MLDIQTPLHNNDLYNTFMQIEIYSIIEYKDIKDIIYELDELEYILLLQLTGGDITKAYNQFCYYNGAEIEYCLSNI